MDTILTEKSKAFLENQEKLKEIIQYYLNNNILLEIITCSEKIRDGENIRFGRFIFDKDKLEAMQYRDGHYLLIVKNGTGICNAVLLQAEDIPKRQVICWKEFF